MTYNFVELFYSRKIFFEELLPVLPLYLWEVVHDVLLYEALHEVLV